jgi:N-acetylglutamate synthase-like GNAT family acetyltransferase
MTPAPHETQSAYGSDAAQAPVRLRAHRVGDVSWIVHRQAALYAQEYGFDEAFEALVSEIGAKFLRRFKPGRERCWVAERAGQTLGAVFLIERSKTVAQLRMLYVEPAARGQGIGKRLVDECTVFARAAGYRKIMLWTNSVLHAARHLYEQAGYRLVGEEAHRSFGQELVGQNWELVL